MEPRPAAPSAELPQPMAARFRRLRRGLMSHRGVVETVRYMGEPWRWAWEYSVGSRKVCWLHLMESGLAITFTLTDGEVERLGPESRVSTLIRKSLREAQRTGPVRWCAADLDDQRAVDLFLSFARRKVDWILADTRPQNQGRRPLAS